MDIIEEIYRNSIQPSERGMLRDKYYRRAKNQVKQYHQMLYEKLAKNEQELLIKLISCYDKKTERKNVYCFESGFKTGLSVAIKSLKQE